MKVHIVDSSEEYRLDLVCINEYGFYNEIVEKAIMDENPEVNFYDLKAGTELLIPSKESLFTNA